MSNIVPIRRIDKDLPLPTAPTGTAFEEAWALAKRWAQETKAKAGGLWSELRSLRDIPESPMKWTWYPYIPAGGVTLLAGGPGVGKGLVSASLAAAITAGGKFPDGTPPEYPGRVLWLETEDPAEEVLKPRLLAAGCDPDRVMVKSWQGDPKLPNLSEIAEQIRAEASAGDLRLIVLSPIKSFLPKLDNANDEKGVREEMQRLIGLVSQTPCSILGLIHLNKKLDQDTLDRIAGSGAFSQIVRGTLGVRAEADGTRRLVNVKHSYGPDSKQFIFTPKNIGAEKGQSIRAEWEVAGDDVGIGSFFGKLPAEGEDGKSASEFLREYLEKHGPTLKADIVRVWESEWDGKAAALNQAFQRGKRKGEFEGEVLGFQGRAQWRLAGDARDFKAQAEFTAAKGVTGPAQDATG